LATRSYPYRVAFARSSSPAPVATLVASDYSAIEAVVIAMLAKEQWRIDAFNAKTDIYLASIARVTGVTLETYLAYERDHGQHHPDRATGKILELALGFGGWINAIRAMETQTGIDLKMTDDEVKPLITAWRDASPAIVELWGGQWRGKPWDG
jgi:DNA polymerase bacteriophage-type